jgi:hypothetical protein
MNPVVKLPAGNLQLHADAKPKGYDSALTVLRAGQTQLRTDESLSANGIQSTFPFHKFKLLEQACTPVFFALKPAFL